MLLVITDQINQLYQRLTGPVFTTSVMFIRWEGRGGEEGRINHLGYWSDSTQSPSRHTAKYYSGIFSVRSFYRAQTTYSLNAP